MASATPDAAAGNKATQCSYAGFKWSRELRIAPTMTLSNDGYCGAHIHVTSNTPIIMQVVAQPQHGTIATFGSETTEAKVRYTPAPGYVGTDSFTVLTGRSSHAVTAVFAVTVTG